LAKVVERPDLRVVAHLALSPLEQHHEALEDDPLGPARGQQQKLVRQRRQLLQRIDREEESDTSDDRANDRAV
jgi:hypothetical protein